MASMDMYNIFDFKTSLTWIVSGVLVMINKGGVAPENIDFAVSILTGLSLIVALGYTITRWVFLFKDRNKKK